MSGSGADRGAAAEPTGWEAQRERPVVRGGEARATSSHVSRTGCVWCPDWPVIAARKHADGLGAELRNRPLIVRERVGSRDIVRAASAEARATGVTRGMRRREAEARCPEAVCVDADEAIMAAARG